MIKGIILSAGYGKRLSKYELKPLIKLLGKSLINYSFDLLKSIGIKDITIIKSEKLNVDFKASLLIQENPLGTADALRLIKDKGTFLVIPVDAPLLTKKTLKNMIDYHERNNNDITILASKLNSKNGYGRIFKKPLRIVEDNDLKFWQRRRNLVNSGVYILSDKVLSYIDKIKPNKKSNEYYFTDILKYLPFKIKKAIYVTKDCDEIIGINTTSDYERALNVLKNRINKRLINSGVFLNNSTVGPDVEISAGSIIDDSVIFGKTKIEGYSQIKSSYIENSFIDSSEIGPYSNVFGSSITKGTIGSFVQIKNSTILNNTKIKHLAYVGNANISSCVNVGAGVVFANYDGKNKNISEVGPYSFVGSNSTIVAPISIGANCFIAAGSVVTSSLNDNAFYQRRSDEKILVNKKVIAKDK